MVATLFDERERFILRSCCIYHTLAKSIVAAATIQIMKPAWVTYLSALSRILYFLEISPRRDLISSRCTLRRDFKGGEILRAATTCSPLTRFAPAFDNANCTHAPAFRVYVLWIRRPFSMRWDFEGSVYWNQPPYRCGEISRAAGFRGAVRFRGNTVNAIQIPRISAHPPILAQCKVHRPWALFRKGTVHKYRIVWPFDWLRRCWNSGSSIH